MKIYVASSWRNQYQPAIVKRLRADGHQVYDFREDGFSWRTIDDNFLNWTPAEYLSALSHPFAEQGFTRDFDAMKWCDACVMVMPCGPSASMEMGWCVGQGKPTAVFMPEIREPDLMVKMANLVTCDLDKVRHFLKIASDNVK